MSKKENQMIISTQGESKVFTAKLRNGISIDFFSAANPEKPFASIVNYLDGEYVFLRFDENRDFQMTQKPFEYGARWLYGSVPVTLGMEGQTEIKTNNGKTFIFRENEFYPDLGKSGMTIGFFDRDTVNLFCRCLVENGELNLIFAQGGESYGA